MLCVIKEHGLSGLAGIRESIPQRVQSSSVVSEDHTIASRRVISLCSITLWTLSEGEFKYNNPILALNRV